MTAYIALLRGVNVGGRNMLAMAKLRAMIEEMGFSHPRTLLQSGNVVFESARKPRAAELEAETEKTFGFKPRYFLRSLSEWRAIMKANPFRAMEKSDPSHLLVFLLDGEPSAAAFKALAAAIPGTEKIHGAGTHLYATFPDGLARSKLATGLIDKTLGVANTGRNWNTVVKLAALAEGT